MATEAQKDMEPFKLFIKKHNIKYAYISQETGYSQTHISRALTGHHVATRPFVIRLVSALEKFFREEEENFFKRKEEAAKTLKTLKGGLL